MPDNASLAIDARWEKPLMPATGGSATLMVRISPTAAPRPGERRAPLDLAFALDRSGSMAGAALDLAKQAVDEAVGFLRDDDRCALAVYDHDVDVLQPLASATARTKTAVRLALRGVDARGSTALSDGWLTACQELAESDDGESPRPNAEPPDGPHRVRRALLLTDGFANVGITEPAELTKHAHELRRRGIATSTLGVGDDYDGDLLSGMAEAGGGNFYHAASPGELRAIFERELGELLTVVAAGLSISLTLPKGLRATVLGTYPSERNGKRIDVSVRDVPANDEIRLIFLVTALRGTVGKSETLTVEAAWADTLADRQRQIAVAVPPILFADEGVVRAATSDPDVREEAALQHAAHERREAMRLDREGRHAESRAWIVRAQERLVDAAHSPEAMRFIAEGDALLAAPASSPYSEATRKQTLARSHEVARRRPSPPSGGN